MMYKYMYDNVHLSCCRGLLSPQVVVEDYGVSRSDPGMLGAGIYFGDSVKYDFY